MLSQIHQKQEKLVKVVGLYPSDRGFRVKWTRRQRKEDLYSYNDEEYPRKIIKKVVFRNIKTDFCCFGSFVPKTYLPTYFSFNFSDFLAPVLSGANDPKSRFIFFLHFFNSEKKIEKNSLHSY